VKALVEALHGAERGHSVTDLLEGIQVSIRVPEDVLDAARDLDQVYITARYPNGFASGVPADYFTDKTSRRLLAHAKIILEFCRGQVP